VSDLANIQRYLKETGLTETRFGRLAVHDPRLIGDMRRGRKLGERIRTRVSRFMAEHRP
jgi:tRNA-dihydrouridine synthase